MAAGLKRLVGAQGAAERAEGDSRWLERLVADKLGARGIDPQALITSIDTVASLVVRDRPDVCRHAAPDGTVTILFTDIEGSTALNEQLGDQHWLDILRLHSSTVRDIVRSHKGYEVKSEGDGFMVVFGSAQTAIECAIAIQRAVAERNRSAEVPTLVRIGLHSGEAVREANDFYGWHVNLASRIADEAGGGEILASDVVRQLVSGKGFLVSDRGVAVVRGFEDPVRLYEVRWREEG